MFNFWSHKQSYPGFRQFITVSLLLCTGLAKAQVRRTPASYIPDDDVIVKPMDNELSFYQQYVASDNSNDVAKSRNQLKIWNDNQIFADQYGMDSSSVGATFYVPTPDEKFEYFKDKYMRYLRQKGEQPIKNIPGNWYQSYRASNEVDTIDEMETRFKKSDKRNKSALPETLQSKEVSLWKKTKFVFQPRVEQGLVIVGIKGPNTYARAWVGVNGQTEMNIQQSVDSIGFRVMFNYYAYNGRYFTSADQRVVENVYVRATSQKDPEKGTQDNTLMMLYAKQF